MNPVPYQFSNRDKRRETLTTRLLTTSPVEPGGPGSPAVPWGPGKPCNEANLSMSKSKRKLGPVGYHVGMPTARKKGPHAT